MPPLVSVLMTAYNREEYIAEAIESVLAQTLDDFELIVADDRSTDNTVEIARRYTTDARVQVYVNEGNLGDYANRNRAATLAQGRYLKYLDADDVMYPHCLELMAPHMERFAEAGIGIESEAEHRWLEPFPFLLAPQEAYQEHYLGNGILSEGPTAVIIHTEFFWRLGGFLSHRYISDTELWLRAARERPVVMCHCGLTWWRQHTRQESVAEGSDSSAAVRRYRLDVRALTSEACPLGTPGRHEALQQVRRKHLKHIASTVRRGRLGMAISLARAMWSIEK